MATEYLLDRALQAIEKNDPEMRSWCANTRVECADFNRLDSLRFICSSLDDGNKEVVCDELKISFNDLEACRRVLKKI